MSILTQALAVADAKHRRLAQGWNTWDTRSVLHHVRLPDGLCLALGLAAPDKLVWLNDAFFGRREMGRTPGTQLTSPDKQLPLGNTIEVLPGPRSYDGAYTQLEVNLRGARYRIETAADGDNWVALVTPLQNDPWRRLLTVQASFLWNRPGYAQRRDARTLIAQAGGREIAIHADGEPDTDPNLPVSTPYLSLRLDRSVAISAGRHIGRAEVESLITAARERVLARHAAQGDFGEAHTAMHACLAWNVIYEPRFDRVLCPVARDWNCIRGGYAVFCWDSFFTAWMLGLEQPALAYAVFIETFREMIDESFVSNVAQGSGRTARDRSQPPVAGLCALGLWRHAPDREALAAIWPALLAWNRWWDRHRRNSAGSLSLGSMPFTPRVGDPAEFVQPNTAAGAALESGLDNLPIYDGAPFDPATHLMLTEDVGLNSLYVADCTALAELARILGREEEARELEERRARYGAALQKLWHDTDGLYLNRRLDNGEWATRQAATSFFPLLAGVATPEQAARLIREHLLNPAEYAGEWMIPAVPRTDPLFPEQLYMRGRIWPPLNFLVYLGVHRYAEQAACEQLAGKSVALLLKNWRDHRTVPENISTVDGSGGVGAHTHPLYAWGSLLALIGLIESGRVPNPLGPAGVPPPR